MNRHFHEMKYTRKSIYSTKQKSVSLIRVTSLGFFCTYSLTIAKVNSLTKEEINYGHNYLWMYAAQLVSVS